MTRRPRSSTLFPYTTLFRSPERDVKRAALREATRWSPPPELEADFVAALVDGLASGDREVRRLARSEEHTSELQSHSDLVCRLLLEKKRTHVCTAVQR